jgi:hypothetical protein
MFIEPPMIKLIWDGEKRAGNYCLTGLRRSARIWVLAVTGAIWLEPQNMSWMITSHEVKRVRGRVLGFHRLSWAANPVKREKLMHESRKLLSVHLIAWNGATRKKCFKWWVERHHAYEWAYRMLELYEWNIEYIHRKEASENIFPEEFIDLFEIVKSQTRKEDRIERVKGLRLFGFSDGLFWFLSTTSVVKTARTSCLARMVQNIHMECSKKSKMPKETRINFWKK